MSNEITATISLAYEDSEGADEELQLTFSDNVSTKKYIKHKQSIGFAAEEAIVLGEVSSLGWGIFINRDTVNYVEIRLPGTGASNDSIKIKPGKGTLIFFGSDVTSPYALANTGAVQLEFMIVSQ